MAGFLMQKTHLLVLVCMLVRRDIAHAQESDPCDSLTHPPDMPAFSCLHTDNNIAITCQAACGSTFILPSSMQCHCTSSCVLYKDCCPLFKASCPHNYLQGQNMKSAHARLRLDCVSFRFIAEDDSGQRRVYSDTVSLIASCLNGDICVQTSPDDVLNPQLALPITDGDTGLHYVNLHCAKCNNVMRIKWWIPRLECQVSTADGLPVITTKEAVNFILPSCQVHYLTPEGNTTHYGCISSGSLLQQTSCPSSCTNKLLVRKCEQSVTSDFLQGHHQLYTNYYCALCANDTSNLECYQQHKVQQRVINITHSLSILYESDVNSGLRIGDYVCPDGQQLDSDEQSCHKKVCPDDFSLLEGKCVQILYTGLSSATLYFNKPHHLVRAFLEFKATDNVRAKIAKDLKPPLLKDAFRYDQRNPRIGIAMVTETILNVSYTFYLHNNSVHYDLDDLQRQVADLLKISVLDWLDTLQMTHLAEVHINSMVTKNNKYINGCTWTTFQLDEFTIRNESVTHIELHNDYPKTKFYTMEDSILVCVKDGNAVISAGSKFPAETFLIVLLVIMVILTVATTLLFRRFKRSLKWKRVT